jgi:chloride channel 7
MGAIAFLMDVFVDLLIKAKWTSAQIIMEDSIGLGWFVYVLFAILFMLLSALMTVLVAPAALGSGVAETMGMLNGVKYPDFIKIPTLFVKFFGLVLCVAAGVCGGKEGPLVHLGAIVGCGIVYLPFDFLSYFRNDVEKRKFTAIGAAAGVSAAFGAPIGGSLFAFEISKPDTFWSFSLTWKVFFASSISTFILNIFKSLYNG